MEDVQAHQANFQQLLARFDFSPIAIQGVLNNGVNMTGVLLELILAI
jgi:hypothetical protein